MDKIKTIKIKNIDGSISQETYTIAVDAKNVDMTNGKDVQETIGDIDIDNDGSINQQLNNLKNNKINITDIEDNLISNETNKVLSAKQGKILNDILKKKPYYFNSIADMKAYDLKVGDCAITLGYYAPNDGGAGTYKIANETLTDDDGGGVHELNNGYKAVLIVENDTINIKQFGAYGDNTHDDTIPIQNALKFRKNDYLKIVFNENDTYLMQKEIYLYSNTEIELNNCTIKSCYKGDSSNAYVIYGNGLRFMNNYTSLSTPGGYGAIKNIFIKNGTIDGNTSGASIFLFHGYNINVENIDFINCCVGTHIFDLGGCKNVNIKNCNFDGYLISVEGNNSREMIQFDYARKSSTPYWGDEPTYQFDELPCENLIVENCSFKKGTGIYYPTAIGTHSSAELPHKNIIIRNCQFYDTTFASIRLPKVQEVLIENNKFYNNLNTGESRYAIFIRDYQGYNYPNITTKNIRIINNYFKISNNEYAIYMFGVNHTEEPVVTWYNENIIIENNICDGDYNSENANETNFIGCGFTKRLDIINNTVNNCKNLFVKIRNSLLNYLNFDSNKMYYCADFIHAVSNDDDVTCVGVDIQQRDNMWTDNTGIININNFKAKITLSANFTKSGDTAYTTIPFDTSNNSFITIDSSAEVYKIVLPTFIKRFKVSGRIYYANNSGQENNKTIRTWISGTKDGGNVKDITRLNMIQYASSSINIQNVSYEVQNIKPQTLKIGIQAYMPNNDTISKSYASFNEMTNLVIEGY